MGKDDLIPQLKLSSDIESDNVDNINEEFYLDNKRPAYYESPLTNMASESFNKFLSVYV